MTDREQLMKLLREGRRKHQEALGDWYSDGTVFDGRSVDEYIIDHLLANGVVIQKGLME
jgi:hypothetical protein